MTSDWYVQRAIELYGKERTDLTGKGMEPGAGLPDRATGPDRPGLFRDDKPMVSSGTNPGAWVMMWAWVPDPPETKRDEEGQGSAGQAAADGNNGTDG